MIHLSLAARWPVNWNWLTISCEASAAAGKVVATNASAQTRRFPNNRWVERYPCSRANGFGCMADRLHVDATSGGKQFAAGLSSPSPNAVGSAEEFVGPW